jgi:hypothetical protein
VPILNLYEAILADCSSLYDNAQLGANLFKHIDSRVDALPRTSFFWARVAPLIHKAKLDLGNCRAEYVAVEYAARLFGSALLFV